MTTPGRIDGMPIDGVVHDIGIHITPKREFLCRALPPAPDIAQCISFAQSVTLGGPPTIKDKANKSTMVARDACPNLKRLDLIYYGYFYV